MQTASVSNDTVPPAGDTEDDRYEDFLELIQGNFDTMVGPGEQLFTTDAADLMGVYLQASPADTRPHRTCHACRQFLDRFGGLVSLDESGRSRPVFWDPVDAPPMYREAARALFSVVSKANVTGVFVSSEPRYGTPKTGKWTHFAATPPKQLIWKSRTQTASQRAAEKHEERGMLLRSLADFDIDLVRKAVALLENGSLYRSEKCLGVAKWLLELHERRASSKNKRERENLTWLAVAGAPVGFCHVRSGMIGTLLEDLGSGMSFDAVKRRFDEKMNPLQYQRPTSAPSAGQIAQAEKLVASLESAGALARRYAKLPDVEPFWLPKPQESKAPAGGVFGHLLGRGKAGPLDTGAPPVTMTWTKFAANVLPMAEAIEFLVPHGTANYFAMVTAENPDAPPILQWDREDRRNRVSWYVYNGGSRAEQWGISSGKYHPVTAVVLSPTMWDPERSYSNHGHSAGFVLKGAKDTRECGLALFPETLRSEYHGIRKAIEAYSNAGRLSGREEAEVCGVTLGKGANWNAVFRVTSKGVTSAYKLDRWD